MMKKMLILGCVVVLAFSAAVASADDGTGNVKEYINEDLGVSVPCYDDARLDSCNLAAPVAIYNSYDTIETTDSYGNPFWYDVLNSVAVWGINADGSGFLALYVTADQLNQAAASPQGWVTFENMGYTLGYSSQGWFWVTAPNGYQYEWTAD